MRARERTLRSEQGAVFVQVGISLFVLMAFNAFVLDYGMMWVGRRQAQNAADAGALAGAVARGYDDFDNPPSSSGLAHESAEQVAEANLVWQRAGTPIVSKPIVSFNCPTGVTGRCVKVEVYRDGTNGSTALPTLFGPILGITTQKVRASATSIVGNANATDCLRPIALPDDWQDVPPINVFNMYDATGNLLSGSRDSYTAPSATQSGRTTISSDYGVLLTFDLDRPTLSPATPITPGLVVSLTLPGAGTFREKLEACSGQVVQLGQTLPVETPPAGQAALGLDTIWLQDPYPPLTWDNTQSRVDHSCAPGCAPISPRIIPIALFNPQRFQLGRALSPPDWTRPDVGCPTNSPCITVTNIVGFFVHCVDGRPCDGESTRHGHFLRYPGITEPGAPTFVDEASWLVTTHLIR